MNRRDCLRNAILLSVASTSSALAQPRLPTLAVLPFDFLDDHHNPATVEAQKRRLKKAHEQLQRELAERHLYRVVDIGPAEPLLEKLKSQQRYMHRCADCAQQVGRLLGTDLVMATWVQKVSELILNVNVEIHDVASGRPVLSKSVDMRGNDDVSWERSVRFLVRDMSDRRARNPQYGIATTP